MARKLSFLPESKGNTWKDSGKLPYSAVLTVQTQPNVIEINTNISEESDDSAKPAIKKSCIGPDSINQKTAIKKSCVAPGRVSILKPERIDRPSKFQKIEQAEKALRVRPPESKHDKLSKFVKMREKFHTTKCVGKTATITKPHTLSEPDESLYTFTQPLQTFTGISQSDTRKNLELKLKEFLRKSAKTLLNAYDFSDKPDFCEFFSAPQLQYIDLSSYIRLNTFQTH